MNVSTEQPFQIVYSLFQHQFLGYLFDSFVVQLDHNRRLTLKYQNISSSNAREFGERLNEVDYELIELIDAIQQDAIIKRYSNKKIPAETFFLKIYDKDNGDKALQETIQSDIERKRARILENLGNKLLFEMANDGNPAGKRIYLEKEPASISFHFYRNEDNTHYFPMIKHNGQRLEFQYNNSFLICNDPAWLVVGERLYHFEQREGGVMLDGKKIQPFLNKKFIVVPQKMEETYYTRFVAPLIESFDVIAKGFDIRTLSFEPQPLLTFSELQKVRVATLFEGSQGEEETDEDGKLVFSLSFVYEKFVFEADNITPCSVSMEKNKDAYTFYKVKRNLAYEKQKMEFLQSTGLEFRNGKAVLEKSEAFIWLNRYQGLLSEEGMKIQQHVRDTKRYFLGKSSINLEVREGKDWFDVYAKVQFGDYEIPFIQLRKMILSKRREFTLPNGQIAVIPEVWFTQYADIFTFMEEEKGEYTLKKYHIALLQELQTGNYARVTMSRKLEKLRDFEQMEDHPLPAGFTGELRPYQKAGYNWLQFLEQYHFGGCLADDMGLGKTVQTLAMLQLQKEKNEAQGINQASLLIMPTSLLYNWEMEARKFTPHLRILLYTGSNRVKGIENFENYDLVLTSYGIARIDVELLKGYYFNYVILDESQAIKNPESNTSRAVKQLNAKFRLILTGTPIENSTMDLWSQMTFVNPGLLGSFSFFKNEYQLPIEKKNDSAKMQRLHAIIKPFILRRHKTQVATELPEKLENVKYCNMTEAQEKKYEEIKSYYRNKILEHIEQNGVQKSQIMLLQGLTQLRQIANHPRMVEPDYEGDSGKLEDVLYMLKTAVSEGHKILVFSQFVKHLALFREYMEKEKIDFAYLDGSTKDRKEQVETFQQDESIQVFLISLKAGGVGLNLTAADYVFILDPWWNPAIEAQAIDRAHRIGQKNNVFIYKFITKNTVEEKILLLQKSKLRLANELITTEEGFVKHLSKTDIESLLE